MASITLKTTNRSDDSVAPDLPVTAKTATYSVVAGDIGKEFEFNSASAVICNLPAAATAGNGFNAIIRNIGAGELTVDPDGAETIDGAASLSLTTGECAWIRCDGTVWLIVCYFLRFVTGPSSTTEDKVPQWDSQTRRLKDGLDFKDEDDMASDSATAVASQQSIKKYVDDTVGGSTGPSLGNDSIILTNADTVTQDVTFVAGGVYENGHSTGPVTIAATKTVTVAAGCRWVVS